MSGEIISRLIKEFLPGNYFFVITTKVVLGHTLLHLYIRFFHPGSFEKTRNQRRR